MKALLISVLAVSSLAAAAEARPSHHRISVNSHPVLASLEEAATRCFVETVMANPKATELARAGRWYEAAGIIGFLCRPEVGRMVGAHDNLYGQGSGDRFFRQAYARHLDRQLAVRLQPLLESTTLASAESPGDKASLGEAPDPAVPAP